MSSLVVSILILAVSAVLAVAAVNLAQALARRRRQAAARPKSGQGGQRKAGETVEAVLAEPADEALDPERAPRPPAVRGSRREPRLGEVDFDALEEPEFEASDAPLAAGQSGPRAAPMPDGSAPARAPGGSAAPVGAAGAAGAPGSASAGAQAAPPLLSPLCDCIVVLPLERPLAGERLIAATQGVRRAGGKPILFDGVPAEAAIDDQAVALSAGRAYRALRIGVLLANRHGPLNAMEYSEFVAAAQSVAEQLATLADTPDMADAIARARDLDATCAQLDAQIGLNVDSPEPLGPQQVAALAAEFGLVDRGGHRHARLGPLGELVFTMSLTDSPQRLGFLLDVPRTAESLEGWSGMIDCAQDVALRLSGKVVDDAGRQIPLESLDTIARQLTQRYASLDAIGIPAGSPLALRVFN